MKIDDSDAMDVVESKKSMVEKEMGMMSQRKIVNLCVKGLISFLLLACLIICGFIPHSMAESSDDDIRNQMHAIRQILTANNITHFTANGQGCSHPASEGCSNCQLYSIMPNVPQSLYTGPEVYSKTNHSAGTCVAYAWWLYYNLFDEGSSAGVSLSAGEARIGDYIAITGHAGIFYQWADDNHTKFYMYDGNHSMDGKIHYADLQQNASNIIEVRRSRRSVRQIQSNAPEGNVDILTGGKGYIRVAGWAKDNDTPDQNVTLHVYVGGQAGNGRTPYVISANKYKSNLGGNYGFDEQIIVSETGEQPVYVYALDTAGGNNPILGSSTVTITPNADPDGILDSAVGGVGTITVRGRVYDEDTPNGPVYVHMYVGGMAGSGAPSYSFIAEKGEDFCYFSGTAAVEPYGTQTIYLYAINTEYGNNPLFATAEVTITKDEVKPVIGNIQISDVSAGGYTITCDVSDNAWVKKVAFPTWTLDKEDISSGENQGDLFADWENTTIGTYQNGKASYRVKTSDHGYETGVKYVTHIYAWDVTGNYTVEEVIVSVPSAITNVQVTDVSEEGYTVSCDIDPNWGDVMKVCFPTWTVNNGQDDLDANWMDNALGEISGNHVVYRVLTSAHNGEKDCIYITHVYAWKSRWEPTHVTQVDFPVLNVYVSSGPVITVDHGTTIGTDATGTVSLPTGTTSVSVSFGRLTSDGVYINLVSTDEEVSTSTFTYSVPGFYMDQPGTYMFRAVAYPGDGNSAEAMFDLVNTQLPSPTVTVSATEFTYDKDAPNYVTFSVPGAEAIAYAHYITGYYTGEDVTDGDGWIDPVMKSGDSIRSHVWYIGRFNYRIWVKVNGLWSRYSEVEIISHPPQNILTLPRGLKRIDSQALAGLENAEALRIPTSVESFAGDALDGTDCILLIPLQNNMNGWLEDYAYEHGIIVMYE